VAEAIESHQKSCHPRWQTQEHAPYTLLLNEINGFIVYHPANPMVFVITQRRYMTVDDYIESNVHVSFP